MRFAPKKIRMWCFASPATTVDGDAIAEGTPLPDVRFVKRTFTRTVHSRVESEELACEWKSAILHMCDSYGGPTRTVVVHIAHIADKVFLKCVERLPKREFEELFGFQCGQHEIGRVASLDHSVLTHV